jgi:hypothetical protein
LLKVPYAVQFSRTEHNRPFYSLEDLLQRFFAIDNRMPEAPFD